MIDKILILKSQLLHLFKASNFRNSYWSVIEVGIYPLLLILVTPYFINKLGAEIYGVWMLVNSIIASLGVLNLGMADATVKFIAKYRGLGDQPGIKRIANTTFSTYLFLFVFVLALSFIAIEFGIIKRFSAIEDYALFEGAIKLGIVFFGLRLIEQIIFAIFKGFERYDIFSKISIASKSAVLIANVIVVILNYSIHAIFLSSIIITSLVLFIEIHILKRFYPGFSISPTIDFASLKETFSFGVWSWMQGIIGIIASQLDKFIVTFYAGLEVLAYYSLASMIATQVFSLFSAASGWIFPYVAKVKERAALTDIYLKMQSIITAGGVISITILFLLKGVIFRLWLGSETYNSSSPYIEGFLFLILINIITIVPYYILIGTDYIRFTVYINILGIVNTIVLMIIMYNFYGNLGLIYGRITSALIVLVPFLLFLYIKVLNNYNLLKLLNLVSIAPLVILGLVLKNWASPLTLVAAILLICNLIRDSNVLKNFRFEK